MSRHRDGVGAAVPTTTVRGLWVGFLCILASACGAAPGREAPADDDRSILPDGPPSDFFDSRPVGEPRGDGERPQIAHVEIVDLDADGLPDILACDAIRNRVAWIRQFPAGTWTEQPITEDIRAPAHVEPTDFDGDGDLDLLVASLGELFPSDLRIGSVVVLENDGNQRFTSRVAAEGIPRVADVRAGDLDGDGDQDLAVAAFGYDHGETLWLENRGGWAFEAHVLQRFSGAVNALVADLDADDALDIVALISQEWEEVWAFTGDELRSRLLWGTTNPDYGSSWITLVDLDRDGDPDILHSNGDAFDYAPENSRPWHGVQWLENRGGLEFVPHRIAYLQGASSPQAVDLDGDGDLDVAVVSAYNQWDDESAHSLVWLENNGQMQFAMRRIARSPTHLITLAAGDLDNDGDADLVTGGMHISGPYDRMSRVTVWSNLGSPAP